MSALRRAPSYEGPADVVPCGGCSPFRITPVTFEALPHSFTMRQVADFEGESRMGERVTPPGAAEVARAQRLKKALESGAAPAFVDPGTSPGNGTCSNHS